MRIVISGIFAAAIFFCGCVQMRDFVGTHDGAVGLDVTKGFGAGPEPKKDYYVIDEGSGLVRGDTKKEVSAWLGSPDKIEPTVDGRQCWTYNERKIKFFFDGDRLRDWQEI